MANKYKTETVYIADEDRPVWEEIVKAAADERRGIGMYICGVFRSLKRVTDETKYPPCFPTKPGMDISRGPKDGKK